MVGAPLNYFFQFSVSTLLMVFQPEIHHVLEQIGRGGLSSSTKGWLFAGVKDDADPRQKSARRISVVVETVVVP